MVLWSNGIDTHLWSEQLGFNSPSWHFICFCSFSQTFRTYIWFQRTLVNIGPILPKSRGSWLPLHIPYPRECNPGVLLIFWVFRPRTVVYFGEKSAKITVFLADFSPKMTKVRPKYVAWGCIQDGVVFTRIR